MSKEGDVMKFQDQATQLLHTLNNALESGLDNLPGTPERIIESYALYNWIHFAGSFLAFVALLMSGWWLAKKFIQMDRTDVGRFGYGKDEKEGRMVAAGVGFIVCALGALFAFSMLVTNLSAAVSPIGYLLQQGIF